jgi:hypothetical protein
MEAEVERIWSGMDRYGDDINSFSLLNARIQDWLLVEPRFADKIVCQEPQYIIRRLFFSNPLDSIHVEIH